MVLAAVCTPHQWQFILGEAEECSNILYHFKQLTINKSQYELK